MRAAPRAGRARPCRQSTARASASRSREPASSAHRPARARTRQSLSGSSPESTVVNESESTRASASQRRGSHERRLRRQSIDELRLGLARANLRERLDDLELEALRHVLLAQQREQRRRGPGVAKLPGGPDGDDTHLRVDLSSDVEQRQQRWAAPQPPCARPVHAPHSRPCKATVTTPVRSTPARRGRHPRATAPPRSATIHSAAAPGHPAPRWRGRRSCARPSARSGHAAPPRLPPLPRGSSSAGGVAIAPPSTSASPSARSRAPHRAAFSGPISPSACAARPFTRALGSPSAVISGSTPAASPISPSANATIARTSASGSCRRPASGATTGGADPTRPMARAARRRTRASVSPRRLTRSIAGGGGGRGHRAPSPIHGRWRRRRRPRSFVLEHTMILEAQDAGDLRFVRRGDNRGGRRRRRRTSGGHRQ